MLSDSIINSTPIIQIGSFMEVKPAPQCKAAAYIIFRLQNHYLLIMMVNAQALETVL